VAVAALPAVIAAVLPFLPLGPERRLEAASAGAGVRVTVGSARLTLLPSPRLVLREVLATDLPASRVARVDVVPRLASLAGDGPLQLQLVAIRGLDAGPALVNRLAGLRPSTAPGPARVTIERVTLEDGRWIGDGVRLEGVGADVRIADGAVLAAVFTLDHGRLRADLQPDRGGFEVMLRGEDWTLPGPVPILLTGVEGQGRLTGDGIQLRPLELRVAGGLVRGDLALSWKGGWRIASCFDATQVALESLGRAWRGGSPLGGRLALRGTLGARAASPAGLAEALRGESEFTLTSGVLRGVDLAAAARLFVSSTERGETRFDRLKGQVEVDAGNVHVRNLEIASGVLSADGAVSMRRDRSLVGEVTVALRGTGSLVVTPLEVSGTVSEPLLKPTGAALAGAVAGTAVLGPGLGTAVGLKAGDLARRLFGGTRREGAGAAAPERGAPRP
jgi:hypothetical protein